MAQRSFVALTLCSLCCSLSSDVTVVINGSSALYSLERQTPEDGVVLTGTFSAEETLEVA